MARIAAREVLLVRLAAHLHRDGDCSATLFESRAADQDPGAADLVTANVGPSRGVSAASDLSGLKLS